MLLRRSPNAWSIKWCIATATDISAGTVKSFGVVRGRDGPATKVAFCTVLLQVVGVAMALFDTAYCPQGSCSAELATSMAWHA